MNGDMVQYDYVALSVIEFLLYYEDDVVYEIYDLKLFVSRWYVFLQCIQYIMELVSLAL